MIRINLLPEELRGRKARVARPAGRRPSALILAALVLAAGLDGGVLWWILQGRLEARGKTEALRAQFESKKKERDEKYAAFQELRDLKKRIENQIEILKSLDPPDRLLWSEKLNLLALAVHPQAFLTDVQVTEKVDEVETQESIQRRQAWEAQVEKIGPEPAPIKVPVITQTLTITGVCTGENEREQMDNALRFADDLKRFTATDAQGQTVRFMDGFNDLMFGDFESTQLEGRPVCKFVYSFTTQPITGGTI